LRLTALVCFLLPACAPVPASITFDGGGERVTVRSRDGVPLKRALVRDADNKPLDPQPIVSWSVDRPDVAMIRDGALIPVGDGVAKIEARGGDLALASYTVAVELEDNGLRETRPGPSASWKATQYSDCLVATYGSNVMTFTCGDRRDFPRGLAAYLAEHGSLTVTVVSPLDGSYLVVTRPN